MKVFLLLYVDDIIITDTSLAFISIPISKLGLIFKMKDMGPLSYFLGMKVTR